MRKRTNLNLISESVTMTKTEASRPVFALSIATSLGIGYLPLAPGTWGSAVAIALVSGTAALSRAMATAEPQVPGASGK